MPIGEKGAGQIAVTSFSVPAGSLDLWKTRLRASGVAVTDVPPRFGEEAFALTDPSGLVIELVASNRDDRTPWQRSDIHFDAAIRGLHSVTMIIRSPRRTLELMTGLLGFGVVDEMEGRIRLAVNGDRPGHLIEFLHDENAGSARNGVGTVHHVAVAIADADEQLRLRTELLRLGYQVTEVRDRQYFRSIYFREPGGVLFEVATVPPGFTVDEELPCLGRDLKLPPWEEPHRPTIEATLPSVTYR